MPNTRWQKVVEIFEHCLDLPAAEVTQFLDSNCADDAELRSEIEAMLRADGDAADFIESPILADSSFPTIQDGPFSLHSISDFLLGQRIGAFQIVRELGHGGMGTVYLAERADGEFRQYVAVKLIKRGMDSDFVIRRFRHERQILANFEHPNIARLIDGGTTPDGLPYFVMEFIEGETLYRFCDSKKMNVRRRLEMFRQICSAVSYAHENQIIHRDIKPNNILVTKNGVPKLLDFGIAKILDPELIHESVSPTASMMRLLTPDYASPEQIRGDEVTTASDVYSLGILLYELLTGHRPIDFSNLSLHEVSRLVCEHSPEIPSRVITKDRHLHSLYDSENDFAADFTEVRGASVSQLISELSGNLDNIILKTLAKQPADRYSSVRDFSKDILRHLKDEKISAGDFVEKIVSRQNDAPELHITGSKSLAVLPFKQLSAGNADDTGEKFLGLGLADAITTRLSKIRSFIVRPTSSVTRYEGEMIDPIRIGGELNVEYILDGHIKRANDRLRVTVQLLNVAKNATVWATSIDETVGDLFSLEDAISTKVTEALLPHLSANELEQFARRGTKSSEAYEQYLRGRYHFSGFTEEGFAQAILCFYKAVAEDPEYALAYTGIADYYNWLGIFGILPPQECFQAAIEAATKAVYLDPELAEAQTSLGFSIHAGNYDPSTAEYHFLRSLELNPHYATTHTWLAILRLTEARFEEGLRAARRSIELDPFAPFNQHNLGWGLYFARRFDESIRQYRQVTADFPQYGLGHFCLAKVLRFVGKYEESLEEIEKAKEIFENSLFTDLGRAESFAAAGRTQEAEAIMKQVCAISADRYVSPYQKALVYCYLGDDNRVFEALEDSFELRESWLNWLEVEPVFDRLREDDRYAALIKKIGSRVQTGSKQRNLSQTASTMFPNGAPDAAVEIAAESSFQKRKTRVIGTDQEIPEKASDEIRERPGGKRRWRWVTAGLIIVLGIFVLYSLGVRSVNRESSGKLPEKASPGTLTLVVLPFTAADAAGESLGVGLADALTNKLGNIRKLSVLSSGAGRLLSGASTSEIAKKLGAGFVLSGSLIETDENIRVTAELVDVFQDRTVWTETFETIDGDLVGIQTKIAERIWTSLHIEPLPMEVRQISKRYTTSAKAYELYLIGRFQMTNRSADSLRKAVTTFSQARDADPDFALAYVGLADAYALQFLYQFPPPPDAYTKSKENALKALALDDGLAEAHASLGYVKFFHERDRAGAELEFRRAIQINPSYATAHHWFALLLSAINNPMESVSEANHAAQLDPVSAIIKSATGMCYFYDKEFAKALEECDKALTINPGFIPAHKVKRWIYQTTGQYQPAMASFLRERSLSGGEDEPGWFVTQAQIEALGDKRAESLEKLNKIVLEPQIKNNPAAYSYEIALSYAAFGEKEKALTWLEKAEAGGSHSFNFLETDPRLDSLRNETRFAALIKKLRTPKSGR